MNLPTSPALQPHMSGDLCYYQFPALAAIPFVRHGVSTRLGGVSGGIYESMNLSFGRGDDPAAVEENFRRFCAAIGVPVEGLVLSHQTHGTEVRAVTAADRGKGFSRPREYDSVDGLMTDEPGVVLCTLYADCVPLLFADPVRRVVAASHAGWKGTVAGIGGETVERMVATYGCRREDILVGIGPSIGPCCFEVDEPVYAQFASSPLFRPEMARVGEKPGKFYVDLWAFNRQVLLTAGVQAEHIAAGDLCTRCRPEVFWSHRATGGERGSLAAFIAME